MRSADALAKRLRTEAITGAFVDEPPQHAVVPWWRPALTQPLERGGIAQRICEAAAAATDEVAALARSIICESGGAAA